MHQHQPQPAIDAPKVIEQAFPHQRPADPNGPQAPFPTNLEITREQEDELMDRAESWSRTLKETMGWNETVSETEFLYSGEGADPLMMAKRQDRRHFVKRAFYNAMSRNEWEWRRWLDPTIYSDGDNLNSPLGRRISRAMAAKAILYFFGTKPYFTCFPVGPGDNPINEAIQKVGEGKMDDSKSTAELRNAIESAFDLGECVVKVAHRKRTSLYKKKDVVLGVGGKPIIASDGEYITQDDHWQMPMPAAGGGMMMPPGAPPTATAAPEPDPEFTGPEVPVGAILKRDGVTQCPPGATWLTGNFARVCTHYSGPEIREIYYRNFLCPINAPSVQEAECCLHIYEVAPHELAAMFTDGQGVQLLQAMEMIRALAGVNPVYAQDPTTPVTANDAPSNTKVKVEEYWMRVDADNDGHTEDILFVRVQIGGTWFPLFYEYVQNVTETKERPFHVIRPSKMRGSWTGIGAMEMYESHQKVVDLMLNRWSFATSGAGNITIFNPAYFEETKDQQNADLKVGTNRFYRLRPNMQVNPETAVKRIMLDDNIGPQWKDLMQSFLQFALNESGVQHANDGAMAGMESTKLATGIRDIRAAGNETFAVFLANLEDGIQSAVNAFIATLYGKLTEPEVVRVTEKAVPEVLSVERRDVQGLRFDVQILLTNYKNEKNQQALLQVIPMVADSFLLQPLPIQQRLQPLMLQLLKSMQIQDADTVCEPMVEADPMALTAALQVIMTLPPELQQILAPLTMIAQQYLPPPETTGQKPPGGGKAPVPIAGQNSNPPVPPLQ